MRGLLNEASEYIYHIKLFFPQLRQVGIKDNTWSPPQNHITDSFLSFIESAVSNLNRPIYK